MTAEDVERLREWIEDTDCPESECDRRGCVAVRMVRSTLEIHKPIHDLDVGDVCDECDNESAYGVAWPCPTVSALVRCLGEEVQNG